MALVAEIVGPKTGDTSTLFSILTSGAVLFYIYMIALEGVAYRRFGTRGLLWTDAGGSMVVCAIVLAVFATRGLGLRRASTSQAWTAGAS